LAAFYGETPAQCWERFQEKFPNTSRQKQNVHGKFKETKIKLIDQLLKIRIELNAEEKNVNPAPVVTPVAPIAEVPDKYKNCYEFMKPGIYEIGDTLVYGLDAKFFDLCTIQLNKTMRVVRITYKKPIQIGLVSGTQGIIVDFSVPDEYDILKRYKGDNIKGLEIKVKNIKQTTSADGFEEI